MDITELTPAGLEATLRRRYFRNVGWLSAIAGIAAIFVTSTAPAAATWIAETAVLGAILAAPINGTIKRAAKDQTIEETVARENLWEAQTPQVFRRQLLIDAYARRGKEPATDDAQLVERLGHKVTIVHGSPMNIKITTKEDLRIASALLKVLPRPKLAGPAHPFADDELWR